MTTNRINDWMKEIRKVARRAAYDWPVVVIEEDMEQDICLHILEAPGTLRDLEEMDDNSRYRTLHKIAQRIASQERVDYEHFSGNFMYAVNEVKKILEAGVLKNEDHELSSSWSDDDYITGGGSELDAALTTVSMQQDLKAGLLELERVNSHQAEVLRKRYLGGTILADTTEQQILKRALISLTTKMNHAHKRQHAGNPEPYKSLGDGPGIRGAVSNSTARYLSKEGWDADYMPAPSHMRDNHIEPEVWE